MNQTLTDIANFVDDEIAQFDLGYLCALSPRRAIADIFEVSLETVSKSLRLLDETKRDYRYKILLTENNKRLRTTPTSIWVDIESITAKSIERLDLYEKPGIYCFTNKNKYPVYIGRSTNLGDRLIEHKRHLCKSIIAKYLFVRIVPFPEQIKIENRLIQYYDPLFNNLGLTCYQGYLSQKKVEDLIKWKKPERLNEYLELLKS